MGCPLTYACGLTKEKYNHVPEGWSPNNKTKSKKAPQKEIREDEYNLIYLRRGGAFRRHTVQIHFVLLLWTVGRARVLAASEVTYWRRWRWHRHVSDHCRTIPLGGGLRWRYLLLCFHIGKINTFVPATAVTVTYRSSVKFIVLSLLHVGLSAFLRPICFFVIRTSNKVSMFTEFVVFP